MQGLLRRRKARQDRAADVLPLQTQEKLVVQLYFQEEELGLGPGISRADLMHAFEGRHFRRRPQHLRSHELTARVSSIPERNARLRSTREMRCCRWPAVKQPHQRRIIVSKVRRAEVSGRAEEQVVPMAIMPQSDLAPLSPWDIARAQKQRA